MVPPPSGTLDYSRLARWPRERVRPSLLVVSGPGSRGHGALVVFRVSGGLKDTFLLVKIDGATYKRVMVSICLSSLRLHLDFPLGVKP